MLFGLQNVSYLRIEVLQSGQQLLASSIQQGFARMMPQLGKCPQRVGQRLRVMFLQGSHITHQSARYIRATERQPSWRELMESRIPNTINFMHCHLHAKHFTCVCSPASLQGTRCLRPVQQRGRHLDKGQLALCSCVEQGPSRVVTQSGIGPQRVGHVLGVEARHGCQGS